MLRKLFAVLLIVLPVFTAHAIEAVAGRTVFYLPDPVYAGKQNPYLESYWQVNPKTLHFKTIPGKGIVSMIQTDVLITNKAGGVIKEDHYVFQTIPVPTVSDLETLNIIELKRYFVTAGLLNIKITLTDLNDTTNQFVRIDTLTVPKQALGVFYGGPEFIDTFYTSDIRTPFRKHGMQYVPLCEGFYDNYKHSLSYYTEVYQLSSVHKDDFPLVQSVYLSRKEGSNPYEVFTKIDTITSDTSVNFFSGTFNIESLPSGNYYLNVSLGTKSHKTIAGRSVFFQRLNTTPSKPVEAAKKAAKDTLLDNVNVLDLGKTFVAKFDMAHLKAIIKMVLPTCDASSTNAANSLLKKPDDLYVRYFVYNHFLAINKEKPEKAWKEYAEKVKIVNRLYSAHGRLGYETDKGFMYLRYGPPTEALVANSEKGALPYEVWQYDILKDMNGRSIANAVILFFKTSQTDFDFRVLHTNIPGELHNMNWRRYLFADPDGNSDYSSSMAEQVIGNK